MPTTIAVPTAANATAMPSRTATLEPLPPPVPAGFASGASAAAADVDGAAVGPVEDSAGEEVAGPVL
jgi:hypothetical protein